MRLSPFRPWLSNLCGDRRTSLVILHRAKRSRRGFTLVEILVVLVIIGLIMGLVGPQVMNVLGDSKNKTAKVQIQSLGSALEVFYLDAGRYPTADEGLSALVQRPIDVETWNGPYVRGKGLPKDPWGNAYVYNIPGRSGEPYEITTQGSNSRAGNREPASTQP